MFNKKLIQSLEKEITRLSAQSSDLLDRLERQFTVAAQEREKLLQKIIALGSPASFSLMNPKVSSESKLSPFPSGQSRMAPGLPSQVRLSPPLPFSSSAANLRKEILPIPPLPTEGF